jgi:y4mF family transcriptional regulator
MSIQDFIKMKRAEVKLTQPELASKAGVGLRFIRDLEQGKKTVRMDKVNQVLYLFGAELGPVNINRDLLLEKIEKAAIHP